MTLQLRLDAVSSALTGPLIELRAFAGADVKTELLIDMAIVILLA